MYVCLDCYATFEEPARWKESRGEWFGFPAYEKMRGCPYCGGSYVATHKCDCCDEWIMGSYVKLESGERICEDCYQVVELGDEN